MDLSEDGWCKTHSITASWSSLAADDLSSWKFTNSEIKDIWNELKLVKFTYFVLTEMFAWSKVSQLMVMIVPCFESKQYIHYVSSSID